MFSAITTLTGLFSNTVFSRYLVLQLKCLVRHLAHWPGDRTVSKVFWEERKVRPKVELDLTVCLIRQCVHGRSWVVSPSRNVRKGSALAYPILEVNNLTSRNWNWSVFLILDTLSMERHALVLNQVRLLGLIQLPLRKRNVEPHYISFAIRIGVVVPPRLVHLGAIDITVSETKPIAADGRLQVGLAGGPAKTGVAGRAKVHDLDLKVPRAGRDAAGGTYHAVALGAASSEAVLRDLDLVRLVDAREEHGQLRGVVTECGREAGRRELLHY